MASGDAPKKITNVGGLSLNDFYLEAGNTGLKVFGGYVVEDFDPSLRGMRGAKMLREMSDTDPTIGAILFTIRQSIEKLEWHFEPPDQSLPSLLAQEFFESVLQDMDWSWDDFISEAQTMFIYGYAPFEIVLKERNGYNADKKLSSRFKDKMIGIKKLALRGQDTILRWIMDADNNEVIGMVQMPWTGGIRTIPVDKLLLLRTVSTKNNPEGRSLLRNAYRPYYFKKRIEELEAIGIERDLAGLPIIKVPAELIAAAASGNDLKALATINAYKALLTNIKQNTQSGVLLPSDTDEHGHPLFELTLLGSSGQKQFDTSKVIDQKNQQIATTVMADFLLLGHSSRGGGQALGSSKIDMFYSSIESMLQSIASALNTQLIPLLGELNGIPEKFWPKFYTDKAEQIDLGKLGAYVNALAASGMPLFPNTSLQNYLLNIAGLPEPDDETQQQIDQQTAQDQQTKTATTMQTVAGAHAAVAQAQNPNPNDPNGGQGSQGAHGQPRPGGGSLQQQRPAGGGGGGGGGGGSDDGSEEYE